MPLQALLARLSFYSCFLVVLAATGLGGCKSSTSQVADAVTPGAASTSVPAYAIFDDVVNDPSGYGKYLAGAGPVVGQYGGSALAVGSNIQLLEGTAAPANLALLAFPNMDTLNSWYQSSAYQPLLQARLAATTVVFSIAKKGLPAPAAAAATPPSVGPKAYAIFNDQVTDPAGYGGYLQKAGPLVAAAGGRALAAGPDSTLLEGTQQPPNLVILEFPNMAALQGWYNSDAYKPLIAVRQAASKVIFSVAMQGL